MNSEVLQLLDFAEKSLAFTILQKSQSLIVRHLARKTHKKASKAASFFSWRAAPCSPALSHSSTHSNKSVSPGFSFSCRG
jgi:hypothetical protein